MHAFYLFLLISVSEWGISCWTRNQHLEIVIEETSRKEQTEMLTLCIEYERKQVLWGVDINVF